MPLGARSGLLPAGFASGGSALLTERFADRSEGQDEPDVPLDSRGSDARGYQMMVLERTPSTVVHTEAVGVPNTKLEEGFMDVVYVVNCPVTERKHATVWVAPERP